MLEGSATGDGVQEPGSQDSQLPSSSLTGFSVQLSASHSLDLYFSMYT